MKGVSPESEFRHLLVGNLDARWVRVGIQLAFHRQTRLRSSASDQIDYDLVADQRFAPPILADEGKQAVLDLVPLARPRREMADIQLQP